MLTKDELKVRLNNACQEVIAAEAELTEIDSHFGDADHGVTMTVSFPDASEAALRRGVMYLSVRSKLKDSKDSSFSGTHAQFSSEKSQEFMWVLAKMYLLEFSEFEKQASTISFCWDGSSFDSTYPALSVNAQPKPFIV